MLDETTPDKRLDYDKTNSNRYGCVIFVINTGLLGKPGRCSPC